MPGLEIIKNKAKHLKIFKINQNNIKIKSNTSSIYRNRGGWAASLPATPVWVCEGCG